ncbi:DUF1800 family protein [soil metagenome]
MAPPDNDLMAAIAVTRFGLGAKPGELALAKADPKGFLKRQIQPKGGDQPQGALANSATKLGEFRDYQQQRQAQKNPAKAQAMIQQVTRQQASGVGEEFLARTRLGIFTDAAFRERWTLFWANHFTVSAVKLVSANQAGPFEREAIRPHVFGRFEDLLAWSSSHPGMLLYLDQAQSVGPDSMATMRGGRRDILPIAVKGKGPKGLNENLAREIMELHTVGLGAGYSQADVTEFARAMTGWSVGGERDGGGVSGKFVFRGQTHEPGSRTVMGKRYPDTGGNQAYSIMKDLAAHPATAHHIAVKLATHFISDDPPASLVKTLEQTFTASGGRLDQVAAALIDAPESWAPQPAKFKTPYDFMVSSWRAVGLAPTLPQQVVQTMTTLGQKPFSAPSPKGWPEEAQSWAAPDAVIKRLAWAQTFAGQVGDRADPIKIAQSCLGARLTPPVMAALVSAESRQEALTVLLMSPEFQRR